MATLYVVEQGTRITKDGGELVLTRAGHPVKRSRLGELDHIVLAGSVEMSAGAIHACLRLGIDVALVTLNGRYRGRLCGPESRHGRRRVAQYRAILDEERRAAVAQSIVRGKIFNQRSLLLRHQRRLRSDTVANAIAGMRRMLARLDRATQVSEIMGFEGQASALYFGCFGELISNPQFSFSGRNRRPPKDPVNAVLSFGYALLLTHVDGLVRTAGLDPAVGMLHEIHDGRPALTLDLMEEFRPLIIDRLALRLTNRAQLHPSDFRDHPSVDPDEILAEPEQPDEAERTVALDDGTGGGEEEGSDRGVYLGETGRRIVIAAFLSRLRERLYYPPRAKSYQLGDITKFQVQALASAIEDPTVPYIPFVPR